MQRNVIFTFNFALVVSNREQSYYGDIPLTDSSQTL